MWQYNFSAVIKFGRSLNNLSPSFWLFFFMDERIWQTGKAITKNRQKVTKKANAPIVYVSHIKWNPGLVFLPVQNK